MQAYQGYTQNGRIISPGRPLMPDGRKVIIVVLDEQSTENAALTHSEKLKNALDAFVKDLNACEPLPDEFEEIVGQLVKFTRQLQL